MFIQLPKPTWVQPLWVDTLRQIQASRLLIAGSQRLIGEAKLAKLEEDLADDDQGP